LSDCLDDIAARYGKMFMRMHRLLDRRMARTGASLSRTKLLMYIDREGSARAADIAELFGVAPRTITEALDGLERDGLIRREPDASDRRVKQISITEEGKRAIAATEPLRLMLVERIFGSLSMAERDQLKTILDKLEAPIAALEAES
jgi:DNA-binding MarR family transcriptional regulator